MSTTIDQSFVRQYESEVHHLFQRQGGHLRPTVRVKDGVVGSSTTFQKIGRGTATTKARHGVITPMNQDHTAVTCTLADFYAGDWVDKLDEAKTKHDERMAIAKGGAWALGRKVDDQIITAMDGTTQSAITFDLSNKASIMNSLLTIVKTLDAADVPNDGRRFVALTAHTYAASMLVESFANSQYVGPDNLPMNQGIPSFTWRRWMNCLWCSHTGLPGATTASAKGFIWHQDAVGYATGAFAGNAAQGQAVSADITWHGDRAAHFINHAMSGGAVLVEDTGVREITINDTTALPTS